MWQTGVEQNEQERWAHEPPDPLVPHKGGGEEEDRGSHSPGQGRVEVPEEGVGLTGDG